MKKWHSECYFPLSGLKGRWTPLLNPIYSAGDLVYIITSIYPDSLHRSACRLFFTDVPAHIQAPKSPPSLVRQHRVIGTRPDGDSATRLVYFLAACIQLQPLFVCRTSDALPIMGSSNARSPSVARPV